jgi:hypothetical protein
MPGNALYSKMADSNPGKYPVNMGKAWLDDEVVQLLKAVKAKKTHNEIALEHGRTLGGIVAKLKGIAADYYFGDKRSLDDIQRFTGLDKETISDAISRREWENSVKEAKVKAKAPKKTSEPTVNISVKTGEPTITEVYELLKDIQKTLKVLVEKMAV